jgi:hypothetical protein
VKEPWLLPHYFVRIVRCAIAVGVLMAKLTAASSSAGPSAAAIRLGERLFGDERFAQAFAVGRAEPVVASTVAVSCRTCHFSAGPSLADNSRGAMPAVAFADRARRSPIPTREDGRVAASRNSPSLIEAFEATATGPLLLHYDGEFATPEELVRETFLGRNFGWLPEERALAIRHFARVIRSDRGAADDRATAGLAYAAMLRASPEARAAGLELPASVWLEVETANDAEILERCTQLVTEFVRNLRFSRDADGRHNGSLYDAFLVANRLPRAVAPGQAPADYARRIGELAAALRAPVYVDDPARALRQHGRPFRFGELELRGMRIFFRSAISGAQKNGAGNCAECHVPPQFTDFRFHNTGVTQEEYDALHGGGAFGQLKIPSATERDAALDCWLPANAQRPQARGTFAQPASVDFPARVDLGLWNVYGNPDLPSPQQALERSLNPARQYSRDEVLARTIARFKTPTLRNLGSTAPYLHNGSRDTLEEVILFYRRVGELARAGKLRNAPPEFFGVRLSEEDVAPLAAFLRALDEDISF